MSKPAGRLGRSYRVMWDQNSGMECYYNPPMTPEKVAQAHVGFFEGAPVDAYVCALGANAGYSVGYPTKVYRTSVRANGKSVAATAVEGYLFDTPRAAELARLAIAMDGTNRQMGLSVEGPPPKRSTNDRRDILEAEVEHCAITPWPVNPHTTVNIEMVKGARRLAKSLTASARLERGMRAGGPGDSGPGVLRALMPESGILTQPLAVVDLEAMHNLADGWSPQETLMPPRRLKKAQAVALVREHFPDASDEAVERIIALAQGA